MRERIKAEEMIEFRRNIVELRDLRGYTYKQIGLIYGRDHSLIIYHYKQAKKEPLAYIKKPNHKYAHIIFEDLNPGKSYAEYCAEAGVENRPVDFS